MYEFLAPWGVLVPVLSAAFCYFVSSDAHRKEREGGLQLLGYFHSHPSGEPSPSDTDRAMSAKDGKVWAIAGGDHLRFWQDNPQGFDALSYEVIGT